MVDWFQKNPGNASVFVLDIEKAEDYNERHIPGALSYRDVKIYDGSMEERRGDKGAPLAKKKIDKEE